MPSSLVMSSMSREIFTDEHVLTDSKWAKLRRAARGVPFSFRLADGPASERPSNVRPRRRRAD